MRKTIEELNEIKKKYNVDILWSFSRFDTYRTSKFEYLLKYIQHKPEDNNIISAYGSLGGAVHDLIENLYDGNLTFNQLENEFDDVWTTNIELANLRFDRSDNVKNDNIKNKYYKDLVHFFKNYQQLPYKMLNEQYLIIKITDDIIFNGYSDAIYIDKDGFYNIVDYKTSTKYSSKGLIEHSAQLVLYSEALRQAGIPKDKIRCCFNFLKYVDIDCQQVNGKIKTRTVERSEIGTALQSSVKTWLKKYGYEDDILVYLDALEQCNDIKCLPEEVQKMYSIKDCYVYIDDIWGLYDKLKKEIISTITEINVKTEEYNKLKDIDIDSAEKLFWDNDESLKAQSYYYNNLCGYTIPTIKPYKNYLDKVNADKNVNLLELNNLSDNNSNSKNEDSKDEHMDLSWLMDLL